MITRWREGEYNSGWQKDSIDLPALVLCIGPASN